MAITKYEPRTEVGQARSLRDEIDRMFDQFALSMGPFARTPLLRAPLAWDTGAWQGAFLPRVDLKETDEGFVLTAELPGMTKDSIDLTVAEDSVTLKGERKEEKEEKGEHFHSRETSFGAFERLIPLPGAVDVDKVEAKMKDGVLTLRLVKAEKTRKREIKIEEA